MSQMKDPSHIAKKRKYDHDLSHVKKFSSSVGHLLPVFMDFAYPGDKYDYRTEMFTQLTDMVSPAMTHITEHVDWFFVPLEQICHTAPDNITGIQDFNSTFINTEMDSNGQVTPMIDILHPLRFSISQLASKTYQDLQGYSSVPTAYHVLRVDEFGIPYFYNMCRLTSLLGMGSNLFSGTTGLPQNSVFLVSPIYLCAYQKIWFDCFRMTDRIENDPNYYNLDKYITSDSMGDDNQAATQIFLRFSRLRYRPWKKDFFSNQKVSPLIDYNSVGMQKSATQSLTHFNEPLGGNGTVYQTGQTIEGNVNTLATLRGMFAVEKLMEITRRAAKHYDAQVLAHFGYKVPQGISKEVYRLGSESSVIQINEVIASAAGTAGDTTTTLGEKGGRGSAYAAPRRKGMRFTAPCHGVIMALYSAVPECDYASNMMDKLNTLRLREDYWQPEFDKLGMSPTYFYQLAFDSNSFINNRYASVLGWYYRYQESKSQLNRVYGAFLYQYKHWTTQRTFDGLNTAQNSFYLDERFFYITPRFIDDIMLLSFKPSADETIISRNAYARDPLLHWFKFYVHKSSEMSNFSLPEL